MPIKMPRPENRERKLYNAIHLAWENGVGDGATRVLRTVRPSPRRERPAGVSEVDVHPEPARPMLGQHRRPLGPPGSDSGVAFDKAYYEWLRLSNPESVDRWLIDYQDVDPKDRKPYRKPPEDE